MENNEKKYNNGGLVHSNGQHYELEESVNKQTVRDISELLHAQYAIITGGKSNEGCPIITFPDEGNFIQLIDEEYRKLIIYLTSVPSLQDSDLGFVLIIDRRTDKWSSVKYVLLKVASFFPGSISAAYVVRPGGFLQKAISEVSTKFFRDEFKFKVVICSCELDLQTYIDKGQLTENLGGYIQYNHQEWIEQRVAVEKFSASTQEISSALRQFTQRLQASELPNDASSCEDLLRHQCSDYNSLKDDMCSASKSGEALLNCIRYSRDGESQAHQMCPDKLINVTAIERLLVQLEETEKTFHAFWLRHESRLRQCLELRRFEAEFKELQPLLEESLLALSMMTEVGDSVSRVDELLMGVHEHHDRCALYMEKASNLQVNASQMIENDHYAVDSIRPKCIELIRINNKFQDVYTQRIQTLQKARNLQERLEKANIWCAKGVELLSSHQIERYQSHKLAEHSLEELEQFLESSDSNIVAAFRDIDILSDKGVGPETKALVHQVLKRVEDVTLMCEKRKISLKKMATRLPRPIHAVTPEPAVPIKYVLPISSPSGSVAYSVSANYGGSSFNSSPSDITKSPKSIRKSSLAQKYDHCSTDCSSIPESVKAKRGHVLKELLETERIYVTELCSILKGYKDEMLNPEMQVYIPIDLYGKSDILFGNMEEIFRFHNDVFLRDLENCINTPELIGLCFVQRKDNFHNLYSMYCQNKPQSEELRRQVGDTNSFFKECQKKLGHRLPLSAYLLKPVQRITKYQLLLKDLLECMEESKGKRELEDAVETMLTVLKCLNDSMHQVSITGFPGNLSEMGKLLMQGSFCVWNEKKSLKDLRLKPAQRHLFLYEKILLFTKRSGKNTDRETYHFKNALKMSQIGLTENVKSDSRKFEVWLPGRQEVYSILPPTSDVKEMWIKEIKKVLLDQFEFLKGENIKHYSIKFQKGASFNGSRILPSLSPTSQHRSLRHTASWDLVGSTSASSLVSESGKTTSYESRDDTRRSRSTLSSEGVQVSLAVTPEEEEPWSSDYSQSDDDEDHDIFSENTEITTTPSRFLVLADYNAMGVSEVSLREGDCVDLIKVGCAGWWYVKVTGTHFEGWAPAAYLERVMRKDSRSSPSISSQESSSGLRPANSRSSVASASNKSEDIVL